MLGKRSTDSCRSTRWYRLVGSDGEDDDDEEVEKEELEEDVREEAAAGLARNSMRWQEARVALALFLQVITTGRQVHTGACDVAA